jgi:hypothetical protein
MHLALAAALVELRAENGGICHLSIVGTCHRRSEHGEKNETPEKSE